MHHHRQIRAAVAHVNNLVVADAEARAQFLKHGDFAPACGSANDGGDFSRFVVAEARAENMIRRNDAFERRLNNLLRCRGDYVEMEFVAFAERVERASKQGHIVLQANALASLDQMLAPERPKIRVMQKEIA